MVVIVGRRQTEQLLQHAMHAGGRLQILATHDMRHTLHGVIQNDGKVIARRRFLAREHDVTPVLRLRHQGFVLLLMVDADFGPGKRAGTRDGGMHVEAQRKGLSGGDAVRAFICTELLGRAGIERRTVGIAWPVAARLALGDKPRDVGTAFETGIDERLRFQLANGRAISLELVGLAPHRFFPCDPEPRQILVDRLLEFRPASRRIDVLDAQQESPTHAARHFEVDQRGQRMPQMQIAIRRRRETENGLHGRHPRLDPRSIRNEPIWSTVTAMVTHINTEADLDAGIAALIALDPRWQPVFERTGLPPLRRRAGGFAGLTQIIVSQQVSVASAAAIHGRLVAIAEPFDHGAVLRARKDKLLRVGLSNAKIKTLKAIAKAIDDRTIDLNALADMPADAAHATLVALHGIGPWTADVYLLACIGHADAWPAGDIALQEAARIAFDLDKRPTPKEMGPLADLWRPYRAVAARLLWTYYRAVKQREGVLVAPVVSVKPKKQNKNGR